MSVRQPQVPAAFEIRFSTTDSDPEVVEIQPDQNAQNIPDPFKKRDKIPRSSGSIEQFSYVNNNNGSNNPLPSQISPIILKQRHHGESSSKKGISTNSDQVSSSLKVKSSNAVGPEGDKQQRINGIIKNERSNSLGNVNNNTLDDDLIIRNTISNKKQRSKLDEISSEKEKNNLVKVISNHQIMDLNGKTDMIISNNKKIMSKSTLPIKNKSIPPTNTLNLKDDENKLLPRDGIATPPATPPRSPQIIPTISQKPSENDHLNSFDKSQLITPPPSSSDSTSTEFIEDSTRFTRTSKVSQSSRKRRGSHSPQKSQSMLSTKRSIEMSAYQPPKKLQQPRGRRSASVSNHSITSEQPLDSFTLQLLNKSKEIQKSSSPTARSRIPRLSTSSRERPTIAQKVSQGSLSSQGSNKFNESKELSASYPPSNLNIEPPRNIRSSKSRPIINTSLITDVEVGSESPTGYLPINNHSSSSHSPTNHSPSSHSPTNHSPTSHNHLSSNHSTHQKKLISYDDVVIPTIAKKLKMNGQLPFVNHDALLGYSEEPEDITPTSENGYMDITDQVVNLFDGPKIKSNKRQSSGPDSQHRRQRKNSPSGHSRNASKTHYIAPRKQLPQQTYEEVPSPTNSQFENSFEYSAPHESHIRNKRGRARREEYIISVREDDDDIDQFIEPHSSMTMDPSEPSTVPTVQVENNDQIYEKIEEPSPVQIPIEMPIEMPVEMPIEMPIEIPVEIPIEQEIEYKMIPTEIASAPTVTSGKKKKDKKKKQKKSEGGNLDEDDYVRKSKCRCAIQ